jgi:hypothetical protein
MLKGSMIAAAVAVSTVVALLAMPGSTKPEPALHKMTSTDRAGNGQWDAYSVSDYYRGEYDSPRLKLAEPHKAEHHS